MKNLLILCSAILVISSCKSEEKQKSKVVVETKEAEVREEKAPDAPDLLLARGEYLAGLMGCEHCHTPFGAAGPDQSKRFAGGLEIPEAFGTWRSPNITQDKETGIGSWTDEQIIASIRRGKRADGEQLFPIMPYLFYNLMSDEDAKALVVYIRTGDPVANKVERVLDLKLPKIPAPAPSGASPDKSNPVAYGHYLTSLMHCAACHTPMGTEGPDMSRAFAGGMKLEIPMMGSGALYSSNLTPDEVTGIGLWSDEEIVASLKQMKKRDGSVIVGPMAMYQRGWYALDDVGTTAIVAFLRSLPAQVNEVPPSTFKPRTTAP
jgi:mono/diheme cytochrome c family protein